MVMRVYYHYFLQNVDQTILALGEPKINIRINDNINGGDKVMDNVKESILLSVKKMIGIHPEYTDFDVDIIMHINSTFMILNQLGIGPPNGFTITDASDIWTDYIPEGNKNFEAVKTYIGAKVRLIFDPPTSSVVAEALKETIKEFEFRLNVEAETPSGSEVVQNE